MEEKINPEQLVRESEFINSLEETGDDDLVNAGKALLRLSEFQQKLIGLTLSIATITNNEKLLMDVAHFLIILDKLLNDSQKIILEELLKQWTLAIRDFLLNEDNEED